MLEVSSERTCSKELPKLVGAFMNGSHQGTDKKRPDPQLVGDSNEVKVILGNTETTALLDSGSCISSVSETFWKDHLSDVPLEPLNDFVKIECADGNRLKYLGYIRTDLKVNEGLPDSSSLPCFQASTMMREISRPFTGEYVF